MNEKFDVIIKSTEGQVVAVRRSTWDWIQDYQKSGASFSGSSIEQFNGKPLDSIDNPEAYVRCLVSVEDHSKITWTKEVHNG